MRVSCTICTDVISSDFAAAPCIHRIVILLLKEGSFMLDYFGGVHIELLAFVLMTL